MEPAKKHPALQPFDFKSGIEMARYGFIVITIALIIGLLASVMYSYVAGFDLKSSGFPRLIIVFSVLASGMCAFLFLVGGMAPKEPEQNG